MNGADESKKLVKEFLKFDTEMGMIESLWVDIESNIAQYS